MSIGVFAPARVDLSPGFTDVKPYCDEMPGQVVNVALDIGVEVWIDAEATALSVNSFAGRLRDAVARRLAIAPPGIRVSTSRVPSGRGLGTSGALSVALAYALSLHAGASTGPSDVVALACASERDTGLTGGTQDQLASVHGGAGLIRRYRDLGRRVPIDSDLDALGDRLVLVHGSGSRNSGRIIEQVLHERPRAAVLTTIKTMNRVGVLMADCLRDGHFDQLAALMNESTELLRALHPDIVGVDLDRRLRTAGALAAKPCGAGGPGAVWATLVDPEVRPAFEATVEVAGWVVLKAAPGAAGVVQT